MRTPRFLGVGGGGEMSEMMDVAHFLAQKLVVTFELQPPLATVRKFFAFEEEAFARVVFACHSLPVADDY